MQGKHYLKSRSKGSHFMEKQHHTKSEQTTESNHQDHGVVVKASFKDKDNNNVFIAYKRDEKLITMSYEEKVEAYEASLKALSESLHP